MSESVQKLKLLLQASIQQAESAPELTLGAAHALTRTLALLWAAHDELNLLDRPASPRS